MTPRPRIDADVLLAQAGWMRALAQSLLRDPASADDVVQDATVAALLHAPPDERGLAPWLSRVVRNFAYRKRRGEVRRADRERRASPPGAEPTPAATVERLELQRTLVEAVLALPEPLRTTLALRYFEGKSGAEIAELQRVPAGTVRWRLQRGLEELRAKLDARAGSRDRWAALLAPFAAPPGTAALAASAAGSKVLLGVFAMKTIQLGTGAAAAALVAALAWWGWSAQREPAESAAALAPTGAAAPESTLAPEPERGSATVPEAETARASVAVEAPATAAPTVPPAATEERIAFVDARFVDEHGTPWSGVRLVPRRVPWLPKWEPGEGTSSDAEGRARLRLELPATRVNRGEPGEVKLGFVASRERCATVQRETRVSPGETAHLGDIVLGAGVRIHGRTTDEQGKPLAAASVGVAPAELTEDEGRMRRHGSETFVDVPGVQSGADGTFVLEGVAPGTLRLWAHAEGRRYAWSAPLEAARDRDVFGVELALPPLSATDRIAGRVVDEVDAAVPHASIWMNERSRNSGMGTTIQADEAGRFELLVQHEDSLYSLTASVWQGRFAETTVEGLRPGALEVLIRLHEKRYFTLRVKDTDGAPVEGAKFDVTARGMGHEEPAESPAAGDYKVSLPDGKFDLEVSARGYRAKVLPDVETSKFGDALEVVLARAPKVRGRVQAGGAPLPGARVSIARDDPEAAGAIDGYRYRYHLWSSSGFVVTDAEGRFELDCDEDRGFWLRATAEGWVAGEAGPLDAGDLGDGSAFEIELTKGGAIEGRVLLPDGADGEGTILSFNHGDGTPRTLRAGPRGAFRAEGLPPGGWQVLRAKEELDPSRAHYGPASDAPPLEWSCQVRAGETTRFDLDLTKP